MAGRVMSTREILDFFETVRVKGLISFRSLCNALKALVIKDAVHAWRENSSGRLNVVDLGCGHGGDLRKWASYRLRSYVGIDGGARCIEEAETRHTWLVTKGQSNVQAYFHTADILVDVLPVDIASVDIVSCMFFLQFCFSSRTSADHVLSQVQRVLKANGIFCCIMPDGDRIMSLFKEGQSKVAFGHFKLFNDGGLEIPGPEREPFNLAYRFALTDVSCTEYIVSPRLLQELLDSHGFVGAWEGGTYFQASQAVLSRGAESEVVETVLHGQKCTQVDWMSLGLFLVVLARRVPEVLSETLT